MGHVCMLFCLPHGVWILCDQLLQVPASLPSPQYCELKQTLSPKWLSASHVHTHARTQAHMRTQSKTESIRSETE